jgi:hypothetical protein
LPKLDVIVNDNSTLKFVKETSSSCSETAKALKPGGYAVLTDLRWGYNERIEKAAAGASCSFMVILVQ